MIRGVLMEGGVDMEMVGVRVLGAVRGVRLVGMVAVVEVEEVGMEAAAEYLFPYILDYHVSGTVRWKSGFVLMF